MRKFATLAAVLAIAAAQPAWAEVGQDALDCPVKLAPADLAPALGAMIIDEDQKSPAASKAVQGLTVVIDTCIERHKIAAEKREPYAAYAFDVIMHGEIIRRLRAHNFPIEALDEALGFGPGRPNQPIEKIEQVHLERMIAATKARGYDMTKASGEVPRLIGMYIGARSGLIEDLTKLR